VAGVQLGPNSALMEGHEGDDRRWAYEGPTGAAVQELQWDDWPGRYLGIVRHREVTGSAPGGTSREESQGGECHQCGLRTVTDASQSIVGAR
jgi:hypothetical protein